MTRVLIVQHEDDCPPAWLGEWLEEGGAKLDVRRPYLGDSLPADLVDYDRLIVLGGAANAHQDEQHAWLEPTRALIREAAETAVPALGICLGHQLAAVAFGGRVEKNPAGTTFGLIPMGWLPEATADPMLGPLTSISHGVHWNDDIVDEVPEGAQILAVTADGAPQAIRYAPTVWGVQCHPEAGAEVLRLWIRDYPRNDEWEQAIEVVEGHEETLQQDWRRLARQFLD